MSAQNPKEEKSLTESKPSIVTTIEKHRIVAHSYTDPALIDQAWALGEQVKKLSKDWDKLKSKLRDNACDVLTSIAKTNLFSKLVLFHGSKGNYIEVLTSTKKKEVAQDLVDECTFYRVDVLTEEREVTLTGPLAKWAVENLPQYASIKSLEDHMIVKRKWILAENFIDKYEAASTEIKPLFDRLKDAGFQAPSVECKVEK